MHLKYLILYYYKQLGSYKHSMNTPGTIKTMMRRMCRAFIQYPAGNKSQHARCRRRKCARRRGCNESHFNLIDFSLYSSNPTNFVSLCAGSRGGLVQNRTIPFEAKRRRRRRRRIIYLVFRHYF